jgi:hypothetical protein
MRKYIIIFLVLIYIMMVFQYLTRKKSDLSKLERPAQRFVIKGYELYKKNEIMSSYNGGHYTDPNPEKRGYEFWSNGKIAKFDRDSNGHYETILKINNKNLIYIGTLGSAGEWIDVNVNYKHLMGKKIDDNDI